MAIQDMDHHEALFKLLGGTDETVFNAIAALIEAGKDIRTIGDAALTAHAATLHLPVPRYPAFTPGVVGVTYNGNGLVGTTTRTTGTAIDRLVVGGPLYSGATGVTLDMFDANIVTQGTAGAVYRAGVWVVDNQDNPFIFTLGVQWATLLKDAGTMDVTTTGVKTVTPAQPAIVPANTWFVVGGVSQVAVCQPTIGMAASIFSPMGQANATAGLTGVESWLAQNGVTGALANFVPGVYNNVGHGVGFRRSA